MNQRAKEYGQRGRVSAEDLRGVLRMYSGGCAACGKRTRILHVDHVKPLALGGKNAVSNMQPLCPQHNTAKGIHRYDYRKTPFILYEPKGGK
jgi:5-methylcytosine-specific restriction endonuclease McrA